MVSVKWVYKLLYNNTDVTHETFSNVETARDYVITKQKEMFEKHKLFFLIEFREV